MSEEIIAKLGKLARQSRELEEELSRPEAVSGPHYIEFSQQYTRLKRAADAHQALQRLSSCDMMSTIKDVRLTYYYRISGSGRPRPAPGVLRRAG